jgi:phospholipid/cholesterol/gamma-HCH transport system substrate-binding protein
MATSSVTDRLRGLPRWVALVVVGLLVIATVAALRGGGGGVRTVSADFSRAVQIFPHSEVRILGVPVGEVTAVIPEGNTVRVEMEYDDAYKVPAEAQAVIITPTLTADRFVQLTPAYTDGEVLADGARIEVQDTDTPIELDRIYRSLVDVTRALGPNGVNRNGTLDEVLTAGSKFLEGRGQQGNETILNMSKALQTFGDGSGDLFATVRALDSFTQTLAANDQAVGQFMDNLGAVSQQLAGEKEELSAVLDNLAGVLGRVQRFVRDNRELLVKDVEDLTTIVRILAEEKTALRQVLDIGPSAMGNLAIAFDPESGTIGSRLRAEQNAAALDQTLCLLVRGGGIPQAETACELFKLLLKPFVDADPINNASARLAGETSSGATSVRYGGARSARDLSGLMGSAG